LGIAHLDELHSRYGGNWLEILAAYNGGEGAVTKWQQRFGTLDGDEFVESITYRETRDYVKKVLTHYRRYQQLYVGPDTVAARPFRGSSNTWTNGTAPTFGPRGAPTSRHAVRAKSLHVSAASAPDSRFHRSSRRIGCAQTGRCGDRRAPPVLVRIRQHLPASAWCLRSG
jgi:hypothetical protein